MRVYNDEIYHFGKIGMKWGHRNVSGTKVKMFTDKINPFKSDPQKKVEKQAFKKEYKQMQKDTVLHPVHSTVEQLKLLKNKPLKALNLDLQTAKELNNTVKKKVDADKVKKQKHIDNGTKIVGKLLNR